MYICKISICRFWVNNLNYFIKLLKLNFSLPLSIQVATNYFRKINSHKSRVSKKTILIQNAEDPYYFCLFGSIISEINRDGDFRVDQYIYRSFNVNESKNLIRFLLYRLTNLAFGVKWVRAYKSFAPFIGFKFAAFNPFCDVLDAILAFKCYRHIVSHEELLGLSIKKIYVGDLINDTYLRFKPSPTLSLNDPYLFFLIWHAYRSIRTSKKYFSKTPPQFFLTSYSTYLQHGIAVRAALLNGVSVYSFGNYQEFSKKLNIEDFYHTKNPNNYRVEFDLLENKSQCIHLAEESFKRKLAGEVDHHFSYMKNSAYVPTEESIPTVRGASIIFLHDFFDSPHVYPGMIFHDFWDWICFTIDCLDSANLKYFVKPHPNQINLNDSVLSRLIKKYPHLKFISPKVTNIQLIDKGIVSAITVYGSVAHEMAYFGIPSIACAKHPHISYSFCLTAGSKEEYKKLILECQIIQDLDKSKMRRESLEFYYMHNLNLTNIDYDLILAAHNLRTGCSKVGFDDVLDLTKLTKILSSNDAFKKFCKNIYDETISDEDQSIKQST